MASSATSQSKRKRVADGDVVLNDPVGGGILQDSSRDASAEDGDTTAPESNERHDAGGPNPKRHRANSDHTANQGPVEHAVDPGEPSDTTEASVDIAERVGRKGRSLSVKTTDEQTNGVMQPPPIGELTHPAGGYRTNSPPTGRAVRVYADGVFDVFHLG